MTKIPHLLSALVLAMSATPAAAHLQDGSLNDVYGRLAEARAAHDVPGMAAGFHPQALLIDARASPPVAGAELADVMTPQRERLVKDGVKIDTAYRVERRQILGDSLAVDAGYMRQTMRREGAPEQTRYARFLVTLKREAAGWKIVGDAAMPSTAEVWNGLAARNGLRFDP